MFKVGFTGTQEGMTRPQQTTLRNLLSGIENVEFHHGDCIGADQQSHAIARDLGFIIISHPPEKVSKRAWTLADHQRVPKPYLKRNRDIVDEVTLLIATPKSVCEELRSGTWSTIRYAKKSGRKLMIIFPNGQVTRY